jgi:hypothetical protein
VGAAAPLEPVIARAYVHCVNGVSPGGGWRAPRRVVGMEVGIFGPLTVTDGTGTVATEALRAYQRAGTVLVEELGIEPGAALRNLVAAAILAQDPAVEGLDASFREQPPASLRSVDTRVEAVEAVGEPRDVASPLALQHVTHLGCCWGRIRHRQGPPRRCPTWTTSALIMAEPVGL